MSDEHPVIFSSDMVRAILDGLKTHTRRVPVERYRNWKVGDRLWVRENWWAVEVDQIGVQYCVFDNEFTRTDELGGNAPNPPELRLLKRQNWRWGRHPNIHLPKEHARIWLEITGIRVEGVQEISEEDAKAEGAVKMHLDDLGQTWKTYVRGFQSLWDSINAKRHNGIYAWDKNPEVKVIEFKRVAK